MRAYLDSNVFVYAVGGESPRREPCRRILRAVGDGRLDGETSVYTVQEVVRQRRRRGDRDATARARAVLTLCSRVHAVDTEVALAALDVVEGHPRLDVADAIHIATAMRRGMTYLVSADSDLDGLDGVERVDPLDGARLESLITG